PQRPPPHRIMHPVEGDDAIGESLVPAEDLRRRVRELAAEVWRDYEGKDLVLVGVLKGAVLFLSDLMRALDLQCEVDFIAVASYGSATKSSGVVRILKDRSEERRVGKECRSRRWREPGKKKGRREERDQR